MAIRDDERNGRLREVNEKLAWFWPIIFGAAIVILIFGYQLREANEKLDRLIGLHNQFREVIDER